MSRRFEKNRPDRALWPLIIIPLLCIGSLATGIFLLSKTDLSTKQHQQGKSLLTASHLSLVPVIQKEAGPQVVAHDYMTALVSGQYNTMWSLLSPQMQAQWPGEAAYASFGRRATAIITCRASASAAPARSHNGLTRKQWQSIAMWKRCPSRCDCNRIRLCGKRGSYRRKTSIPIRC